MQLLAATERRPTGDAPAGPGTDRSGRSQRAQPRRASRRRDVLPACAVNEVIEHWPERGGCRYAFSNDEQRPLGTPTRHQVQELPAITATAIEHGAQRVRFPECARRVRGELGDEVAGAPSGVARGAVGGQPRLPSRRGRARLRALRGEDLIRSSRGDTRPHLRGARAPDPSSPRPLPDSLTACDPPRGP